MYERMLEREISRDSVFADPSKLSPDYVPEKLVHRDEEFKMLSQLFRQVLENKASQRVLITGSVGVGKTATTRKFGELLGPAARKRNFRLDYLHVNCRKQKTPYTVLRKLLEYYNPRLPARGFAPEELLGEVIKFLNEHDAYLVLTLDEFDFFVEQNGPDMLYSFTRATEESGAPNRLSVIAIARDKGVLRLLDAGTQSTFMHNTINMDKYNAKQLSDILTARVQEAFKPNSVGKSVVSLIADIAARRGDARFALELLLRAGMVADSSKSKKVLPEHARQSKADVQPEIRRDVLEDLQIHEQILMLALVRRLKITKEAYALTGDLVDSYRVVCEEYREDPRKQTQVWEYLKKLEGLGLVETRPSGASHRGRSRQVSVPDVPLASLEKDLEKVLKKREKNR